MSRLFRVALGLFVLGSIWLAGSAPVSAITFTQNGVSGVWDSDTNTPGGLWDPDGGPHYYPIAGDQVTFNTSTVYVVNPAEFGGVGTANSASSTNTWVQMQGDLTHQTGGIFTLGGSSHIVFEGNGGTFINKGTINKTTNAPYYVRGTGVNLGLFDNQGTINSLAGGTLFLDTTADSFFNSGNYLVSGATAGIYSGTGANRSFNNSGLVQADGATLNVQAQVVSAGGTIKAINGGKVHFSYDPSNITAEGHITSASTQFDTTGGATAGAIDLGGKLRALEGSIVAGSDVAFRNPILPDTTVLVSFVNFGATAVDLYPAASPWIIGNGGTLEFRSPINLKGAIVSDFWMFDASSKLINQAANTIDQQMAAPLYIRGNSTYENNGTHLFTGGARTLNIDSLGGGTVNNTATGIIKSQATNASINGTGVIHNLLNAGTLQADGAGNKLFINAPLTSTGGSILATSGGIVSFDTLLTDKGHVTSASTSFDATTGAIHLGGKLRALEGTIVAGSDVAFRNPLLPDPTVSVAFVNFGATAVDLYPASSPWIIGNGGTLEFRSPINLKGAIVSDFWMFDASSKLINQAANTIDQQMAAPLYIRGNSTYENNGTHLFTGGTRTLNIDSLGGGTVNNTGSIISNATNASINGADAIHNLLNSGTLQADGAGAKLYINAPLTSTGGTISGINGGAVVFNTHISPKGHSTTSATIFSGNVELGGTWKALEGTKIGSNVVLNTTILPDPNVALSYVDLDGSPLVWTSANLVASQGAGTLEFRSPVTFTGSAGYYIVDGGWTLANAAGNTFEHQSNNIYVRSGSTLSNAGLYRLTGAGAKSINPDTGTATLHNTSTGTIRLEGGSVNITTNASSQTFNNEGTLELQSGTTFTQNAAGTLTQWNGSNTLTGGTWKLFANSGQTTTLTLGNNIGVGAITKIGAGANVVLSRQDLTAVVSFNQLGAINEVAGSLAAYGTTTPGLDAGGLAVSGKLIGNGTFTTAGGVTFTGGELNPENLAGLGGTLTFNSNLILSPTTITRISLAQLGAGGLNDLIQVNGSLTAAGVLDITELAALSNGPYRLFNYTGSLSGPGFSLLNANPLYVVDYSIAGQVNLLLVPEPTTAWLLAAGLLGLVVRRRRNM